MTYEYFLIQLENKIRTYLEGDEKVRRVQVLKNNGVRLDGFCYHLEGHKEQPTVYVNHYYRNGISDREIMDVARLVLQIQRDSRLKKEKELEQILDFEKMKSHIYYRLISRSKNEELLQDIPWIPWLDMALVFYLRIPDHIINNATALIHTSHMEHWGITRKRLYRLAVENMMNVPMVLDPMGDFLEGYGYEVSDSGMYVLRCDQKDFGASAIVNPKVMQNCFRQLGEDYYVLPSSIHEVVLLKKSMATTREELDALIQEVNATCVSQEDYLSDHAYLYCSESGTLS